MGLYALSVYTDFKKLKHNDDHDNHLSSVVPLPTGDYNLSSSDVLLGLGGAIHDNLDFLNNTKVPIYITGLGGAGVFTTITAVTGLYATDSGSPCCLNFYSFELLLMLVFQITVVGLIYSHRVYIPEDQKKSAEDSKFAKFLLKQEKISKALAMSILCLQVICIMCACTLKSLKWKPRDEFDFDDEVETRRENTQPLLHFSSRNDDDKDDRKKGRSKAAAAIASKYYDDV